jgi:hypothetical protein
MFAGWTASVELSGAAAFAHDQAANIRSEVQSRLSALSRPTNLRYVDDQAVAALAATLDAIGERSIADFRDYAIVAAPRAIGKNMLAASMERYTTEGAWGVSPQIIPNGSLHSVSGLLSVALGMIGPNIGAGGVHARESEAFLAAMSMIGDGIASKLWVVLTGVDDKTCRAVALTLQATAKESSCENSITLRPAADDSLRGAAPHLTLESLFEAVSARQRSNQIWTLPGGLALTWHAPVLAEALA